MSCVHHPVPLRRGERRFGVLTVCAAVVVLLVFCGFLRLQHRERINAGDAVLHA
ncbi:hypothetical protein PAMC26577_01255 [Caballeronia sordidicola]|uniref:Uncharacterized protein n=1 Tax=Caballeronia sordidicola TaxID=196367 RepID=A0A242N7Y3_CABSO|nr:hypothetical protein PAMC26577_01255 [Caballeronia sordidicola]